MPREPDAVVRDMDTLVHEAAHAVAAYLHGARLVRIIADRHHADDGERGSVEYYWPSGMVPVHEAFVCLAGPLSVRGVDVMTDYGTTDERDAAALLPREQIEALRVAVWEWLQNRRVRAAIDALAKALADTPVMSPLVAEEIIRNTLIPRRTRAAS